MIVVFSIFSALADLFLTITLNYVFFSDNYFFLLKSSYFFLLN